MSALCADLEIIRATPKMCAASSSSCPENSYSPEASRFCLKPVHLGKVELPHLCDHLCCLPGLVHGLDILCTDGNCVPGGDDGLWPDGFQLTLAFTVWRHTSSSWRSTFSQVCDVCCYPVWRLCSNKVSTGLGS
ncbi:hypothetical protein DPMN_081525 [Dreissena polymorpha]|uniref:Uncharacterized protein n=1 Tax=Dreissena polymorpha TaxID=45954 RepID=A0A9D4B9A7_DREPO|nr:hypothetical protein DPMN_081525 [Dreissena polymorpha]